MPLARGRSALFIFSTPSRRPSALAAPVLGAGLDSVPHSRSSRTTLLRLSRGRYKPGLFFCARALGGARFRIRPCRGRREGLVQPRREALDLVHREPGRRAELVGERREDRNRTTRLSLALLREGEERRAAVGGVRRLADRSPRLEPAEGVA